ncbi:hypothetical protein HU200_055820 [Digitaria exilis]|uniref:Uncharacterized protein n=1 Tax=Digitaria exilis TaxID=1010633 RepID=A0A835AT09_9POAL|nr:hypothetical protein HU200_055820 [Digitaria exilis]
MPISSTLSARLGTTGPAAARSSPYARPSVPEPQGARGGGRISRPPLRLGAATARLLGPARKAPPSGSGRRAAADAADSAAPIRRSRGVETTTSEETVPKPEPEPEVRYDTPPLEKRRGRGGGGFVFLCALSGHTEAISGISVPSGSDKLYSGSVDGSVRVWDCNSGRISCGGPYVYRFRLDYSLEAWNTQTGMKLSLQGPSGLVCSMAIMDEMLFAGKESNIEPVSILSGHQRAVISLSISATRLYSGSLDKTIKVWDLMTLQCVQTLSEHKAAVTSVLCWGEKLLSCSLDKTVKVWTLSESGNLQVKYTHAEEHGLRTLFGMHRVGKSPILFCSLHNRNCIRLLDLQSFKEVGTLFSNKEMRTIELADGGPLFTGDCSGELKVWRWGAQDQEQEAASAAQS